MFKIKEGKPLYKVKLFWIATLAPLLVSLIVSIPLMENLIFDFSAQGYSTFLSTFKFPLWIASSSIAFGMIVTRWHSSLQRAASINELKSQNNFSNFLNHRDNFAKYVSIIAKNHKLEVNSFKLYGIIFNDSTPENVSVTLNPKTFEYFQSQFESQFWGKMKNTPFFSKQEVNIYFPRFLQSIGINIETSNIEDYETLKKVLVSVRHLYREAMEYGTNIDANFKLIESQETDISSLIGQFDQWAFNEEFKQSWS